VAHRRHVLACSPARPEIVLVPHAGGETGSRARARPVRKARCGACAARGLGGNNREVARDTRDEPFRAFADGK